MSTSTIALCSRARLAHVRNQLTTLRRADVERIVVWIGDDPAPQLDAERILTIGPGTGGLRLAAGRNAGAAAARASGADLLVFLDADCVPGPDLLERYRTAAIARPRAVLCGPVTYLPPGVNTADRIALQAQTSPHAARPNPRDGTLVEASEGQYTLFWSLSFATTVDCWTETSGFDEGYEGYGGEDTDFAFQLRARGIPLIWVGGAHAYHQHHATTSPPWQHLDDILRNGARFAARWGEWPMTGWLEQFADAGVVRWDGVGWIRMPGVEVPLASVGAP